MSLPNRRLGKTDIRVPVVGLGTGPGGMGLSDSKATRLYHRAIDSGITYIDTAPGYGRAHPQLKEVLRERRGEVVLATKAPVSGRAAALESIEKSLGELGVRQVDICFVHSLGGRDVDEVVSAEGALAGLAEAKERGWTRFIGFTAHNETWKSARALELFPVDVVMLAVSYAHRFIYDFEAEVLPLAQEQDLGVVAMKVYGGARKMKYDRPCPSAFGAMQSLRARRTHPFARALGGDLHRLAFLYSAGQPGVASVVVGAYTQEELEANLSYALALRRLTGDEEATLDAAGREAAKSLGEYLGPRS